MSGDFEKLKQEALRAVDETPKRPPAEPEPEPAPAAPALTGKMKNCPDCRMAVSKNADMCPHCGLAFNKTTSGDIFFRAISLGACAGLLYALFAPVDLRFALHFMQQGHTASEIRDLLFVTNFITAGGLVGIIAFIVQLAFRR
jgi:hypothetical protein